MDRTLAANYVTNAGKRQYQDLNLALNQQGTALIAADRTAVQEELIGGLIEGTNQLANAAVLDQGLLGVKRLAGGNTTTVSAAGTTTLTADNAGVVLVSAAAGNVTIALPAAAAATPAGSTNPVPLRFQFVRTDATANTVGFAPAGSDTFADMAFAAVPPPILVTGFPIQLISDGASQWVEFGEPHGMQAFSGSGTFIVPSGVTFVKATVVGGGGGGGAATTTYSGGGGGAGGAAIGMYAVTPGQSIVVTVGAAGANPYGGGGAGGTSSFGTFASATGGNGGGATSISCAGGSGGLGSGGASNFYGGQGSDGPDASATYSAAAGGVSIFGGGGRAGAGGGQNGQAPGSGGGGAYNGGSTYVGGAGAPGIVIVEW